MGEDDLTKPLGMAGPSSLRRPRRWTVVVALCGACAVAIGFGVLLYAGDPKGGEPFAVASLPPPASRNVAPPSEGKADDKMPTGSIRAPATATGGPQIENGVSVYRAGKTGNTPGPLVIKVQQALGLSEVAPVDKRLIEQTRYGPLPKIAADGTRPSDLYARPPVFSGSLRPGTPRVAICMTGLGVDQANTDEAINRLPAAVTLGFSAYGDKLDGAIAHAKLAGHEVVLELPVRQGAGDATPGPHRLRLDASSAETIDDLHWLMSRTSGYAGVSILGGPPSNGGAALTTLVQEIGRRGLLYIHDGASSSGEAADLPQVRATMTLGADASADAVHVALTKLEAAARANGSAVLGIDASPAHLAAVADFAPLLESKGLVLVPVSALTMPMAAPVAAAP